MFADIIVDISVESLDKTYQYKIPESMETNILVGTKVFIPFGKGNRKISGFVYNITSKAAFPVERMKEIDSVDEGAVVTESELIRVAGFIHDQYGCTMNEALKTVLPIKNKVKAVVEHWIHFAVSKEQVAQALAVAKAKNYKARVRLMEGLIAEGGTMSGHMASNKYKITKAVMDEMIDQGIIIRNSNQVYRNPLDGVKDENKWKKDVLLNHSQQRIALDFAKDYENHIRRTYLLHGVTGSGKTEVYMEMMKTVIGKGKQIIALIPEISLTKQTVMRFYAVFGDRISILNSRMSFGERFDQYERARNGEIDIIVGPRSALFVPFSKVGLILIDEEHEGSYKSESTPKYHAREVAIYRAGLCGASVMLGSATPSVESYDKAMKGIYKLYELPERAGAGTPPEVSVIDLREELANHNHSIFSEKLKLALQETLKRGEQAMLFINRRGFAGFVSCRSCGYVLKCSHCDVSLTAHKNHYGNVDSLMCHYCGEELAMPDKCPECGSPYIAAFGLGTQKVEEMTKKAFPEARVLRMDADTTTGKGGHEKVLGVFRNQEADILIGTQMIVKGHDFPKVTLVGILAADLSMYSNDYHSGERTFQLLMQAAGRAGRDKLPGQVVIQTYNPDHYCIQAVKHHDYKEFFANEMAYRRMLKYPPVWSIMAVLVMAKEEKISGDIANQLAGLIPKQETVVGIGPAAASILKIKDWYRYVLYVKTEEEKDLIQLRKKMEEWCEREEVGKKCLVSFDINPMSGY